jgi:hypothetical protein
MTHERSRKHRSHKGLGANCVIIYTEGFPSTSHGWKLRRGGTGHAYEGTTDIVKYQTFLIIVSNYSTNVRLFRCGGLVNFHTVDPEVLGPK